MSHASDEDYTIDTDPAVLFEGSGSCVLNPEATEGPFCKILPVSRGWEQY